MGAKFITLCTPMAFSKLFLNFCIFFGVIAENMFIFSVYYWLSFYFIAIIRSLSFFKRILLKNTEKENIEMLLGVIVECSCHINILIACLHLHCMWPSLCFYLFLSILFNFHFHVSKTCEEQHCRSLAIQNKTI